MLTNILRPDVFVYQFADTSGLLIFNTSTGASLILNLNINSFYDLLENSTSYSDFSFSQLAPFIQKA